MEGKIAENLRKKNIAILLLLFFGIVLRYWVMSFGYNYDFESYCVVGDLAGHLKNVYAQTNRYNYGPMFFCVQGLLYRISYIISTEPIMTYRVLIVSLLSLIDLGITLYILDCKNIRCALCFFLNPVSIIITGYHNQFDNIAVLLALYSLYFYNEDDEFGRRDWMFMLLMSFSLMTKHIFFLIPIFILLKKGLPLKKKIAYAVVPPVIFLASFIPFAVRGEQALNGIITNVFLYRSYNNAPLLHDLFELVNFPNHLYFYVYVLLMCIVGLVVRKRTFSDCVMIYLIAMVVFASAIANQYLAIPMAALCLLELGTVKYIYMIAMSIYLFLDGAGLRQLSAIKEQYPSVEDGMLQTYVESGYKIAALILFAALIYEAVLQKRLKKYLAE